MSEPAVVETRSAILQESRSTLLRGDHVWLEPYSAERAADVVRLRNLPTARYFLHQTEESTLERQAAWHAGYLERNDDIFWVMVSPADGKAIGCTRLYDWTTTEVEKGSLIVDPAVALAGPVALEAELTIITYAFEKLGVQKVFARTRPDNVKVKSMDTRMGFQPVGSEWSRGFQLDLAVLEKQNFRPEIFTPLLDHWRRRRPASRTAEPRTR